MAASSSVQLCQQLNKTQISKKNYQPLNSQGRFPSLGDVQQNQSLPKRDPLLYVSSVIRISHHTTTKFTTLFHAFAHRRLWPLLLKFHHRLHGACKQRRALSKAVFPPLLAVLRYMIVRGAEEVLKGGGRGLQCCAVSGELLIVKDILLLKNHVLLPE